MSFVSEEASEQDIAKYKLREINDELHSSQTFRWTIDRHRDIYLRYISNDWQEPTNHQYSFYWKGQVLPLHLRSVGYRGNPGGPLYESWELMSLDGSGLFWLPPELEPLRSEITSDLKGALAAHAEHVSKPRYTSYEPAFLF
jgi:hypothetical protein